MEIVRIRDIEVLTRLRFAFLSEMSVVQEDDQCKDKTAFTYLCNRAGSLVIPLVR